MPGNQARNPKFGLFHYVKVAPKGGKSTDREHNLITSKGGQDTSAFKIAGHSQYKLAGNCLEIQNLAHFTTLKWHQKEENEQTMTII